MQHYCLCGIEEEIIVKDYVKEVNGKAITIHNVKHYYCKQCDSNSFNLKDYLVSAIKYAYDNNLDSLDIIEYHKIRLDSLIK